jgi:hypothetical protein
MKTQTIIALLIIILASCAADITSYSRMSASTATITLTPSVPVPTLTVTSIPVTAPPRPTIEVAMTPEPVQLARWMEYQDALAQKFLPTVYSQGTVLCEWELLGQSGQDVYVWAFCQAVGPIPSAMSAPAVIYLGTDGAVQGVEIPGSGSLYASDVRRLFPSDAQEKIFAHLVDVNRMRRHIYFRLEHPEPPLIVFSATSVP